jgi:hypothetical protein
MRREKYICDKKKEESEMTKGKCERRAKKACKESGKKKGEKVRKK